MDSIHLDTAAASVNRKSPQSGDISEARAPFAVRDSTAPAADATPAPQGKPGKALAPSGRGKPRANGNPARTLGNGRDLAKTQKAGNAASRGLRPFAAYALELLALGYSPLPVEPGQKRPAAVLHGGSAEWQPWSDYCETPLSTDEIAILASGAAYGLGLACGYGGLVAIDIDTDDAEVVAAVHAVHPARMIGKRGAKGATWFFRDPCAKIAARAFQERERRESCGRTGERPPGRDPANSAPGYGRALRLAFRAHVARYASRRASRDHARSYRGVGNGSRAMARETQAREGQGGRPAEARTLQPWRAQAL